MQDKVVHWNFFLKRSSLGQQRLRTTHHSYRLRCSFPIANLQLQNFIVVNEYILTLVCLTKRQQ